MRRAWLFLIFVSIFLSGCSRAWIVRETEQGGTIGYSGGTLKEDEGVREKVRALIKCPKSFKVVQNEAKSDSYTRTDFETVTTSSTTMVTNPYDGTITPLTTESTTQVPVQKWETEHWRELTYRCENNAAGGTGSFTSSVREP
jgi:hypothetical protein